MISMAQVEVFSQTSRVDEMFTLSDLGSPLGTRVLVNEDNSATNPVKNFENTLEVIACHGELPKCRSHERIPVSEETRSVIRFWQISSVQTSVVGRLSLEKGR